MTNKKISTSLHSSPFLILGVTTRDHRQKIVEQAEERALHIDHELCQKARSELTNPRARLAAEIRWLPGVAPKKAEQLVEQISQNPSSIRVTGGLPDLAFSNLMAAAFELVCERDSAAVVAEDINKLAWVAEYLNAAEILRDINEDRAISGFPEVRGVDVIEDELAELHKAYKLAIKTALDSMPPQKLVETMTAAVNEATESGEHSGPSLIHEIVDTYEVETHGFLDREFQNVSTLIEGIRGAAPNGRQSISPLIDKLETVARNWDMVAQPIQLSAKARGLVHQPSREIAFELRSLGVDLFKHHDMLDQAKRMTNLLQELFAELPEVVERLDEDSTAILDIERERQEQENNKAEWEREITFRAEVGVVFKDVLSISPTGISWKGKSYPLDSITRVRWGGVRNSVNGVPTGTDYTIAFGDNRSEAVVSLRKEATYSGFVERLWRAVCVRLVFEMSAELAKGQSFSFGDIFVEDGAVTLTKHKLFGSERIRLSWHDVHIWTADGSFVIGAKDDKKIYSSASYVTSANTHVLEQIVRSGFKKGVSRLSDFLKD